MNEHTLAASLRAAGAGTLAVDLPIDKKVDNAFCAIRPPVHHAEHNKAMGFCFFNNIAVAAAHAPEEHKLERIAIVDFNVHHGNRAEDIFENNPCVMVCSSYQHSLYRSSDQATIPRHLINRPLKPYSVGPEFRMALQ